MRKRWRADGASGRTVERALALLVAGLSVCLLLALATTQASARTVGRAHAAEALMLDLVNDARVTHGLPRLRAAADVAEVAWLWSFEMARSSEFEHNPDFHDQICCWSLVLENVAYSGPHALWRPGDPVERLTRELHDALLTSPGHRTNILHRDVDQVGIGIHVDRDGAVWITQNFRRHNPS